LLTAVTPWADPSWTRRLTPRLSVAMVDEELPFGREGGRKSWYLAVTGDRDLVREWGPVPGLPTKGNTLLLFEDDLVALVQHLFDGNLIEFDEDGRAINGKAHEFEELNRLQAQARAVKRRKRTTTAKKRALKARKAATPGLRRKMRSAYRRSTARMSSKQFPQRPARKNITTPSPGISLRSATEPIDVTSRSGEAYLWRHACYFPSPDRRLMVTMIGATASRTSTGLATMNLPSAVTSYLATPGPRVFAGNAPTPADCGGPGRPAASIPATMISPDSRTK
jgi:hypothetical protein